MGLFSDPRRDFLFKKTARFIGANGLEIATINLVVDPKKPDENVVIFLKTGGPENKYHVIGKHGLEKIIGYVETASIAVDFEERSKRGFGELVGLIVLSFIRGFKASFRLETHSQIFLEDAYFDQFGKMLVGSDFGSQKKQFYVMYTADEMTTLDSISKSGLVDSLQDLKEIYEACAPYSQPKSRSFDEGKSSKSGRGNRPPAIDEASGARQTSPAQELVQRVGQSRS
jgi:hypothetical protein